MSKLKAYTYHHTHWDSEWYFTKQEAQIQLIYHVKELLHALDKNMIRYYHLDGKSGFMEFYFKICPEDKEKFSQYVQQGRIILGPLYEQLSAFIAPGESIIKNLSLGILAAKTYGGSSFIAYIPDSFGQIQDYPKIFNGFGIQRFIFRRGMGDIHNLKNEFRWLSDDGSEVLTCVLQAGYSFAGLAFMEGRLIKSAGLNLDKKSIIKQMQLCGAQSALDHQFLFPAGKDNCPVLFNFNDLIKQYNNESEDFEFIETDFEQYFNRLEGSGVKFESYQGEFYTTQYHRVHKSIFSARPDIKIMQDKLERLLIYEVQPLMCLLDAIGIPFENNIIDEIWKLLINSQTHSEATNSDEVNEQILKRAHKAYLYAHSLKVYLSRKIAYSVNDSNGMPLTIFNTLPYNRTMNLKITVYTKSKRFNILNNNNEVPFSIIAQKKVYGGWKRKHRELLDDNRDYYESTVALTMNALDGCSYNTLLIKEEEQSSSLSLSNSNHTYIENEFYRIELFGGQIGVRDKKRNLFFADAIVFEDSGDCGDTFDYDYPDNDMQIWNRFDNAAITDSFETEHLSEMTINGSLDLPKNLASRAQSVTGTKNPYQLTIRLTNNSPVIELSGYVRNRSENHRIRLVISTGICAQYSLAGTQFGFIKRACMPDEMNYWKQEGWLEEPCPIEPLLNHVSLKGENYTMTAFTKGTKEYEIIGEDKSKIALTLFRSVGHFGLPDLNRRPGRASGIPEEIMECPLSQMLEKEIQFDFGLAVYDQFTEKQIQKDYIQLATEPVYFQKQNYNRIFTPMKYFEINKSTAHIKTQESLLSILDGDAIFSTLTKSIDKKAFILRLYNNSKDTVKCGRLDTKFNLDKIEIVDFLEKRLSDLGSLDLGTLNKGEIKTYKLYLHSQGEHHA